MKLYKYEVRVKYGNASNVQIHRIEATSILDAKNRIKARFNGDSKLIVLSAVKTGEVDASDKSNNSVSSGSSVVGTIMGAAIAAGIGLFLKSKKK